MSALPFWAWFAAPAIGLAALLGAIAAARRSRQPEEPENATFLGDGIPDPAPDGALSGGLAQLPLPDLLQFLAQSRRSGRLEIVSGRRHGRIDLAEGRVRFASFRRSTDLEALFEMLDTTAGDFRFAPSDPPSDGSGGRDVVDVVMLWLDRKEAAR